MALANAPFLDLGGEHRGEAVPELNGCMTDVDSGFKHHILHQPQ